MAAEVKKSRISAAGARSHTRKNESSSSSQLPLALGGEAPKFLERSVHQLEQLCDSTVTRGEFLNSEREKKQSPGSRWFHLTM